MSYFRKTKQSEINLDWGRKNMNSKRDMRAYWENISRNFNLTQDDVRQFPEKINWLSLSMNKGFPFTDDFLTEFKDKIVWNAYAIRHDMPEAQFLKFRQYIKPAYFVKGKAKAPERKAMAEKYWAQISPTDHWIDYYEDTNQIITRNSSERDEFLWPSTSYQGRNNRAPISWDFTVSHMEDNKNNWSYVTQCMGLNPKVIDKYFDKLDKDQLVMNIFHSEDMGKISEYAKKLLEKCKPYITDETVKIIEKQMDERYHDYHRVPDFAFDFVDEFDRAYRKVLQKKRDTYDNYWNKRHNRW